MENEFAQYLCYERCDAIVIGLLNWAMRNNQDIKTNIPITEELLYNINNFLIPSLVKNDSKLNSINIIAPTASEKLETANGVGTGVSCGIDSFHTILDNYNSKYKSQNLTHLCINSVGSFHKGYSEYGIEKARDDVRQRAVQVAKELKLPLIISDSNIKEEFDIYFALNHTYYSMFAVYCLQKLWKTYYYASGIEFSDFSLENNSEKDTAYYELLSLQCFSTHHLQISSYGATNDRLEKTRAVIDNKLVQKHLHVCCREGINCGTCLKCRRTLLTLDILEKLDNYRESFDIDYYKAHRNDYLRWLYEQCKIKNEILEPIYKALKHEFNLIFKLKHHLTSKKSFK